MNIRTLQCFQHVKWTPTSTDLRKFAVSMLVGFALIGAFVGWRAEAWAPATRLWAVGAGLAVGAMIPGLGKFVYLAVYVVTGVLGYVISRVLLTAIFFVVVTPLALLLRIIGKDLLLLRPSSSTRWLAHAPTLDRKRYYRQS